MKLGGEGKCEMAYITDGINSLVKSAISGCEQCHSSQKLVLLVGEVMCFSLFFKCISTSCDPLSGP